METLLPLAAAVSERLKSRKETLAVVESSVGGLLSAALLATPGASAFFLGGAVVYTRQSRQALLGVTEADLAGIRPATERYALLLARRGRERLGATWCLAETGAAGPAGNRYGDSAGHACIAVGGPSERSFMIATGSADRLANMRAFGRAALELLREQLG